jgi:hypothetical protein
MRYEPFEKPFLEDRQDEAEARGLTRRVSTVTNAGGA